MLARILMLCAVVCGPGSAAAQSNSSEFPTKLITIVVPYPAGGSADILARVVADRVRSHLQQPAIVENRAGATGSLGATRFGLLGLQPTGGTSQTFGRFVETDRARWKAIIEAANLSK
jgi:hypothetical protein